tara:strand:- start:255719 stop:256159 length:441 start_codon:yes stop_codon:yes gene_type:complete
MKATSTATKSKPAPTKSKTKARAKSKPSPVSHDAGASRAPAKKASPTPTTNQKLTQANTARRATKPTPLSCLQAAAVILADAPSEGWSVKETIERMAEKKLWTSANGKTPEATLYGGMVREIARKRDASRFKKVGRGRFTLNIPKG